MMVNGLLRKKNSMQKVDIIAEIGTSHQGDLSKAKELIHACSEAGATCAKFQAVFADEIIHPNAGLVPLPTGNINLYSHFKSLEKDFEFYAMLKHITESYNLDFLCTPFGIKSFDILNRLNVSKYKVASPELNHLPLLRSIAKTGKSAYLSLGVSKISDIETALETISTINSTNNNKSTITLLHCITSYPAKEEEYNLNQLPHLKALFNVEVGVSDHSLDPILVPSLAVYLGASAVEKHICLSKTDDGLDDPIALEPKDFAKMCLSIKNMQLDKELQYKELINKFGVEKINAVLGNGEKKLADGEKSNYNRSNRTICATNDLKIGTVLSDDNMAIYRCEKELKPGLNPKYWDILKGRKLRSDIKAGNGINFDDLGDLNE